MQASRAAQKLRAQIQQYSGIISPRFSKPKARFIEQMLWGIAASQDCKLSRIARALGESITLKKTEDRLSHHLAEPQLGQAVAAQIVAPAARRIGEETLIVIDPTDLRKTYAQAMPYLATVRDGSTGELVPGYWSGVALACEPASRRVLPLLPQLWSAEAPDFVSENAQLLAMIDTVAAATDQRGIYVLDRGGDRSKLYLGLLARSLRFIVRLVGDRHLMVRGQLRRARDLARGQAAGSSRRGPDPGGGQRFGAGTLTAPDQRGGQGRASFGVANRARVSDALAGGRNHSVHQAELSTRRPAHARL